jgi:molybdopterin synthase catalytic subunit
MKNILVTSETLSLEDCMALVMNEGTGGIVNFVGTVRNQTKGEKVLQLEFEAYEKMAVSEMNKIADIALEKFDIQHIVIHHRTGMLKVKEIPVIIVVAAAHRKAAFEACEYTIDTLKKTVPIWKKEFFENGTQWVSAHP